MADMIASRIVLAVQDLERSVTFYRDRLGFVEDFATGGWSFLSRGSCRLMIGHCPDTPPASTLGDHNYIAYVQVTDIDDLHQEFSQRGLTPLHIPETKPWGIREMMVVTPDGHRMMFGEEMA
ncbi:bleomycin resistance protein [Leeia aquatica]|uniref:Bleomycin resistance protein n=1 Tax=Leeia aquatica TaxID=2725557 RepID=A0A847SAF5_9NEIS|nr:VOC family protein [Leeia aquatica]NLR74516.1 VOC family protein [Leeia aquatica]